MAEGEFDEFFSYIAIYLCGYRDDQHVGDIDEEVGDADCGYGEEGCGTEDLARVLDFAEDVICLIKSEYIP